MQWLNLAEQFSGSARACWVKAPKLARLAMMRIFRNFMSFDSKAAQTFSSVLWVFLVSAIR
jgi:hypothetical protein